MKSFARYIFILFCCNMSLFANDDTSCHLMVGFDDAKPFHYLNEEGKVVGSDAQILLETLNHIGCTAQFVELPWARTLKYVKSGRIDIAIGASFKEERSLWSYYSVPYKSISHWIYTKSDEEYSFIYSIEDLFENDMKLGVVIGWNYSHDIRHAIDENNNQRHVVEFESFKQLPKVLNKGRVDAIVAIPRQLKDEIAKDSSLEIFVPRAQYKEQLHYIFSKKSVSSDVVVKFNNALYSLIYNGTANKILKKY